MRSLRITITALVAVLMLAVVGCEPIETTSKGKSKGSGSGSGSGSSSSSSTTTSSSHARVKITASKGVCWKGKVGRSTKSGCGSATVQVRADNGTYHVKIQKTKGQGRLVVALVVSGDTVDHAQVSGTSGVVALSYANG